MYVEEKRENKLKGHDKLIKIEFNTENKSKNNLL